MNSHRQAVAYYSRAAHILEQYKGLESFKGIYDECTSIMTQLKELINAKIDTPGLSQFDLVSNFEMLTKLHVDTDTLCTKMLGFARVQFEADRAEQEARAKIALSNQESALEGGRGDAIHQCPLDAVALCFC